MSLIRTLNTAVTGLLAHQTRMDVISNNIANVNTTAFKAQRATFQDLLSNTLKIALGPNGNIGGINPSQVGMGVMLGSIDTFMTQGTLESTGRPTDIAIQGDGFFIESKDARNQLFTRDGNFSLDSGKEFVDSATGYKIQGWNVGNNSTNPDPFAIDTSLPTQAINLPIGVKKMAKATTTVDYASNLNADSLVRKPNFSSMRVRPANSSDWQTVAFKWTEITDSLNNHRWEWSATVPTGGGRVVGANAGALVFNDAGEVTTNTQPTLMIADANGNQVQLFIAPDRWLVAGANPTRPLSHMNVRQWQTTQLTATSAHRLYEINDDAAADPAGAGVFGQADRNILVAVDPEAILAGSTADGDPTNNNPYTAGITTADGIPLEGNFVETNNWTEGSFENELNVVPEWRLATTTVGGVTTYKYAKVSFWKGTDPGTTDVTGAVRGTLQNENGIKDPSNTTADDLAHRTDNNYWVYKFELFRNDSNVGAGRMTSPVTAFTNDAGAPAVTGQVAYSTNGGAAFTAVNNGIVSRSLVFSDTGYVSGGDGTQGQVQIAIDSGAAVNAGAGNNSDGLGTAYDDMEDRIITPPLANSGPDPLTFVLNAGADPNLQGVFNPGDVYRNSAQVYDSLGSAHNMTLRWSKGGTDEWDAVAALPQTDNAQDSLTGNYLHLTFNTGGRNPVVTYDNTLLQNLAPATINFSPAGANSVAVNPNFTQATEFAGDNTQKAISQDGFPMGVLQTFVIENSGAITGVYENGLRSTEAQLAMAMFRNPEGLTRVGNNIFKQSPNSGIVIQGTPDTNGFGQTFGGELEASNVDLAVEFTNLIITQRGFQANTRSVTTADEMVQDVIAMKR